MVAKDERLHKKAGSAAYFKSSWMVLPKISKCGLQNEIIYLSIISFIVGLYFAGGVENTIKSVIHVVTHITRKQ